MTWRFELWNITNATRHCHLDVISASISEALAGEYTMELSINPFQTDGIQYIGLLGEGTTYTIHAQKYIRAISPAGATIYFIVRRCAKQRNIDGRVTINVQCEHHKYALLNRIVQVEADYTQINATEFLSVVMNGVTGFSVVENQIPTAIYRDVSIAYPTVMGALKYLCDTYTQFDGSTEHKFYYTVDNTGNIRIKRDDATGTITGYPLIVKHNLSDLLDERSDSTLANRIYHSGLDNTIGFCESVPVVDSSTSTGAITYFTGAGGFQIATETFTMNDGGLSTNPVAWESIVIIRLNSLAPTTWPSGSGSFIVTANIELLGTADAVIFSNIVTLGEVTYPNRATGNPKWFAFKIGKNQTVYKIRYTTTAVELKSGANPDIIGILKTALEYELAPNVDYVQDAASQSTYGLVEARIENRDHPPVVNVIRSWKNQGAALQTFDATLSGTYTGGLCNVFSETLPASVTTTENSDTTYVHNGTRSQRVSVGFPAQGVRLSTAFPRLVEGWTYQAYFLIYVLSGQVQIKILQDYPGGATALFSHETTGYGWLEVLTETGFGLPSGVGAAQFDVQFLGKGTGAVFYIDSFTIARSPEPISFYKDNSANLLKDRAQRILRLNANPRTRYEVTCSDLANIDNAYNMAALNVGDDIYIKDNESNVNTLVKIYRKDQDLFDPTNTRLVLADRTTGAAELVSVLAGERNLGGL